MKRSVVEGTMIRRTRVEVDLAAIVANARAVQRLAGTALYAVVKADGYGHGAVNVATALSEAKAAAGFGVSLVEERVPLLGLISTDIASADVTDVPEAQVGDAAVLLGRASGGVSITCAEYAAWAGLSEYEVTCGMSKRVPRTYVEAIR